MMIMGKYNLFRKLRMHMASLRKIFFDINEEANNIWQYMSCVNDEIYKSIPMANQFCGETEATCLLEHHRSLFAYLSTLEAQLDKAYESVMDIIKAEENQSELRLFEKSVGNEMVLAFVFSHFSYLLLTVIYSY